MIPTPGAAAATHGPARLLLIGAPELSTAPTEST